TVDWNGSAFLVVWNDGRNGGNFWCARVSPDGKVLDPGEFPILQVPGSNRGSPSIAWDGSSHLLVWEDWGRGGYSLSRIQGTRLPPDGRLLGLVSVSDNPSGQHAPRVSMSDGLYLVVWTQMGTGPLSSEIHGARVTPGGAVLDPSSIVISAGEG